jgi:hypothetical protein
MAKTFIIYDERARHMSEDDCTVLSCCETLAEALQEVKEDYPGAVIISYDQTLRHSDKTMVCSNPRREN